MSLKVKSIIKETNSKYNPSLDKFIDVDLFPQKTALAKAQLKGRNIEKEIENALRRDSISDLFDFVDTKRSHFILNAINHKLRQRIIKLFQINQTLSLSDLSKSTNLEHSILSEHLTILIRSGILFAKKEKRITYYELDYLRISKVKEAINLLIH